MFEKIEAICGKQAAEELRQLRADVDNLLASGKSDSSKPSRSKAESSQKKTDAQE